MVSFILGAQFGSVYALLVEFCCLFPCQVQHQRATYPRGLPSPWQRGEEEGMEGRRGQERKISERIAVPLEGKAQTCGGSGRNVELQKESLPRMSKNDAPSSFGYHSCAGRKAFDQLSGIISGVWVSWKSVSTVFIPDNRLGIVLYMLHCKAKVSRLKSMSLSRL